MVMYRDQNSITIRRLNLDPFKWWKNSNSFEQPEQIKILFRNKLRADWGHGMLVIIQCRIFCLPVCYPNN